MGKYVFSRRQLMRHTRAFLRVKRHVIEDERRRLRAAGSRWDRLRRHARAVGAACVALRRLHHEKLHERYRPGGVFFLEAAQRFRTLTAPSPGASPGA